MPASDSVSAQARLSVLSAHLATHDLEEADRMLQSSCVLASVPPPDDLRGSLTVVDDRTGRTYQVSVSEYAAIKASDLKQITTGKNDKGLRTYDPGYLNTAPVRSLICYINGGEGILRYRGYPIEELVESSTFVEVAYLLSEQSLVH